MSKIDFSQVVSAEARSASAAAAQAAGLKADCAARIAAVMDERTILNIQGAAIAGDLSVAQMTVFKAGRVWVAGMQAACRAAIDNGDTADWPEVPDGVAELAADF